GEDPSVVAQGFLAVTAWISGRADEANRRVDALLGFARERAHPFSWSIAWLFACWLYQLRRDPARAREAAGTPMAVAAQQGFREWLAWGEFVCGWARTEAPETDAGRAADGIAEIERGYAVFGARSNLGSSVQACLAEAYLKVGRAADALTIADAACAAVEET